MLALLLQLTTPTFDLVGESRRLTVHAVDAMEIFICANLR